MAEELREMQVSGTEGYGFEVRGEKMRPYARKIPLALQALALFYCMLDPATPLAVKIGIATALGYVVSPVDAVPDVIPGVGWLDDAGAILAAVGVGWAYVKPEHLESAKAWLEGHGVLVSDDDITALLDSVTGRRAPPSPVQIIDVLPDTPQTPDTSTSEDLFLGDWDTPEEAMQGAPGSWKGTPREGAHFWNGDHIMVYTHGRWKIHGD
jgi:uncharacterized membrane protein YkvA (DUF1232 family)